MSTYAVLVSASFFDQRVGDMRVRAGEVAHVGRNDALAVPLPEGASEVAEVAWRGPRVAQIRDWTGKLHQLEPDGEVVLNNGPLEVRFAMVEQVALRRSTPVNSAMSFTWFSAVVAAMLVLGQAKQAYNLRCLIPLFPEVFPETFAQQCIQQQASNQANRGFDAEYINRLLRQDYGGEDNGAVASGSKPREKFDKTSDSYIPAGNKGPDHDMGGAEKTALRPVRTPHREDMPEPKKVVKNDPLLAPEGVGVPVDVPDLEDGVTEAEVEEEEEEVDEEVVLEAPAEDKEGWGFQDWYDAEDERMDELEIETMLKVAKFRLRIDPNDPEALSLLSYYQYLAEDFDAATGTYDKFIKLYPENSAGYNNKALVYKRLGRYKDEEALYRVALTYSPNDYTALNNLAVNLAHQGRHEEAIAIMKDLEILDPGDPYADLHRSKIYAEMGKDELAFQYLEKALQGMAELDTLHHIEFRQDIRVDTSFARLRETPRFKAILWRYYGEDTPLPG